MDENLARGLAEKTVNSFLQGCLEAGMIDQILKKYEDYSTQDVAMIKQELQAIADEHASHAEIHREIEHGNVPIRKDATDKLNECVQLYIEGDYNQVLWESLGYSTITLSTETPEEAIKLFEALQTVKEVEAD